LHALQRGQSCGFTAGRFEMLVRPGPRLGEAARALADCLVTISSKLR
jgi:iron complex transport system substrate-binding protein